MNRKVVVLCPTHDATDRISQLPQPILHHILNFLDDTKDVVRAGILSKTWHRTFTSFPISFFYQSRDGPPRGGGITTMEDRIRMFLEFVWKSLQSQCRIYGTIPEFYLTMTQHSPDTSIIEDCIHLALQSNVKELQIMLTGSSLPRIVIPQTLLSAKQLIMLKLYQCHLFLPPTHGGAPTWSSLRRLSFQHCHVDGRIFQNLTFSCPLLESLFLLRCDELPDLILSGLTKLTKVNIHRKVDDVRDIMVELDAPSLQTFFLSDSGGHCNVDLTACKNLTFLDCSSFGPMFSSKDLTNLIAGLPALKSLYLKCKWERIRFSSQLLEHLSLSEDELMATDLTDLIAGLPALKSLYLKCKLERIKFSSQRLETLNLSVDELMETDLTDLVAGLPALKYLYLECKVERIKFSSQQLQLLSLFVSKVVEVSIDAPNLKTLACSNEVLSSDLFMGRSNPQEVCIHFRCVSSSSLLQLRKFLAGFRQIKLLKLCILGLIGFLPAESTDIPLPTLHDIKQLLIITGAVSHIRSREDCAALLNGLLCICRPESISITFRKNGKFMTKVFCEELSEMVKGQHCCTDDDHIKCWGHDLRSFRIKQSGGNGDAKFISRHALLELVPTADELLPRFVEIHFMLEW